MERYTESREAYDLYLKGRDLWSHRTEADLKQAIDCFHSAIDKDPDYAPGYSGLADALSVKARFEPKDDTREQAIEDARRAASKALEIDDNLAEAHTSMAYILHVFENDHENAEQHFRRAISLDPSYLTAHHWYSVMLNELDRLDEALSEGEEALKLDPLSTLAMYNLAWIKSRLWRWQEVEELHQRAYELDPANEMFLTSDAIFQTHMGRVDKGMALIKEALDINANAHTMYGYGLILYNSGKYAEALEQLRKAMELNPKKDWVHILMGLSYARIGEYDKAVVKLEYAKGLSNDPKLGPLVDSLIAPILFEKGQKDKANELFAKAVAETKSERLTPYWAAVMCFGTMENDRGFEFLEEACRQHEYNLINLRTEYRFEGVRSDPRFKTILKNTQLE